MAVNPQQIRLTLFLSSGYYSWSEGYFTRAQFTRLAAAAGIAAPLADARAQLLGLGATLDEVRLSWGSVQPNPNANASSKESDLVSGSVYRHAAAQLDKPGVAGLSTADDPNLAVIVRLEDLTSSHRKNVFLSGYPDGLVTTRANTVFEVDVSQYPIWWSNFQTWRSTLGTDWGWRALRQAADGALWSLVNGLVVDAAPPNEVGLVTPGAPGLPAAGATIQVSRFPHIYGAKRQINGLWTVSRVTAPDAAGNQTIFLRNSQAIDPSQYATYGVWRTQSYAIFNIVDATIVGAGRRKRGVRTNRPLGRRRTAR